MDTDAENKKRRWMWMVKSTEVKTKNVALDLDTHKFLRMESVKTGKSTKEVVRELIAGKYGRKNRKNKQ